MTAQGVALRLLRFVGVTSLAAQSAGSELESITDGDLQDCAVAITAALQEIFDLMPTENKERTFSFPVRAPVSGTVTATKYSTTISAFSPTFQSYMKGCTIVLAGDNQDNEIVSATELAAPFMGTTGSGIVTTIYSDAFQLDDTVDHVLSLALPNQPPLIAAQDRNDYLRYAGTPLISGAYPFLRYYKKAITRPRAWFVEGFYDSTLAYAPKRIKLGPMPEQDYSVQCRVSRTPPRVLSSDIDGTAHADPGFVFPIPSNWVESILIPVALQRYSGSALFKNESQKAEIGRQYKRAVEILRGMFGRSAVQSAVYI